MPGDIPSGAAPTKQFLILFLKSRFHSHLCGVTHQRADFAFCSSMFFFPVVLSCFSFYKRMIYPLQEETAFIIHPFIIHHSSFILAAKTWKKKLSIF